MIRGGSHDIQTRNYAAIEIYVLVIVFFFTQACAIFSRQGLDEHTLPNEWSWEPERRLTTDPGDSQITFNFAHSVAVDERGRVHVVWYDHKDGNPEIYYRRGVRE